MSHSFVQKTNYRPSEFDHFTDGGAEEQMKKKIKALEDKVAELKDTNGALSGVVRTMRREKAATRRDTNSDQGSDDNDGEDGGVNNDSPMLFRSRNVCILHILILPCCLHLAERSTFVNASPRSRSLPGQIRTPHGLAKISARTKVSEQYPSTHHDSSQSSQDLKFNNQVRCLIARLPHPYVMQSQLIAI